MVAHSKLPDVQVPQWPELAISALSRPVLTDAKLKNDLTEKYRCVKPANWASF
jgi:hypothetical protein